MKIDLSGNFIKAEDCAGGEICQILDEGEVSEITSPEKKVKTVLNFGVRVIKGSKNLDEGKEMTYTPNKAALAIFVDVWGDESTEWINKRFKITLAKVNVFGELKNSIVPEPLNGDESNEKPKVKTIKL